MFPSELGLPRYERCKFDVISFKTFANGNLAKIVFSIYFESYVDPTNWRSQLSSAYLAGFGIALE